MSNQAKKYDDDDGRVICDMDVAGMRWYEKRNKRGDKENNKVVSYDQLTQSEARRYTWNAILASLLMVFVFSLTWVLFILFCINVWFR